MGASIATEPAVESLFLPVSKNVSTSKPSAKLVVRPYGSFDNSSLSYRLMLPNQNIHAPLFKASLRGYRFDSKWRLHRPMPINQNSYPPLCVTSMNSDEYDSKSDRFGQISKNIRPLLEKAIEDLNIQHKTSIEILRLNTTKQDSRLALKLSGLEEAHVVDDVHQMLEKIDLGDQEYLLHVRRGRNNMLWLHFVRAINPKVVFLPFDDAVVFLGTCKSRKSRLNLKYVKEDAEDSYTKTISKYSHDDAAFYQQVLKDIEKNIELYNACNKNPIGVVPGFLGYLLTLQINDSQSRMRSNELQKLIAEYNTEKTSLKIHVITDALGCLYVWFRHANSLFYSPINQQESIFIRMPKTLPGMHDYKLNTIYPSINGVYYVSGSIGEYCDSLCKYLSSSILMYAYRLNQENKESVKITLRWLDDRPFLLLKFSCLYAEYTMYDYIMSLHKTEEVVRLRSIYSSLMLIEQNGQGLMAVHFVFAH